MRRNNPFSELASGGMRQEKIFGNMNQGPNHHYHAARFARGLAIYFWQIYFARIQYQIPATPAYPHPDRLEHLYNAGDLLDFRHYFQGGLAFVQKRSAKERDS